MDIHTGAPLSPADRADYERHVAQACAGSDEPAFAVAWMEGWAMPLHQVLAYAAAPPRA